MWDSIKAILIVLMIGLFIAALPYLTMLTVIVIACSIAWFLIKDYQEYAKEFNEKELDKTDTEDVP